jgi:hypothetical protein
MSVTGSRVAVAVEVGSPPIENQLVFRMAVGRGAWKTPSAVQPHAVREAVSEQT